MQREGPMYLTVNEQDGFIGHREITYVLLNQVGDQCGEGVVRFEPAPPAPRREDPVCQLVVEYPEQTISSRRAGDEGVQCVVKIPVLPPNLAPGLYRIRADVADKKFYLWGDVRPGATSAEFRASIPVKKGAFTITFTPEGIPRVPRRSNLPVRTR